MNSIVSSGVDYTKGYIIALCEVSTYIAIHRIVILSDMFSNW